jgi:hypothetical protein
MAGLAPTVIGAEQIRRRRFAGLDAVVFGDGAAREIIDGWDLDASTRRAPWQPAQPSQGIGSGGVEALADFVRGGGRLVTIGRSAGLVAPSLVPVGFAAQRPGIGVVKLRVAQSGRWLFAGVPLVGGEARGFIFAVPGGQDGGYLLRPSVVRHAAAWYAGVIDRPEEQSFAEPASLSTAARNAAIVSADVGKGHVVMFGFSPVFRAQWRATFALLFNAVTAR